MSSILGSCNPGKKNETRTRERLPCAYGAIPTTLRGAFAIAALACAAQGLHAQEQPAQKPEQTQTDSAAGSAYQDLRKESANPTALDYLYKEKGKDGTAADSAAKGTGALTDKLKALDSIGQAEGMDAESQQRFTNYLHSKPYDEKQVAAYQALYANCLTLIKADKISDALATLIKLDSFPWDNGFSGELVSRIQVIFDSEAAAARLKKQNEELDKQVQKSNWNADLMAQVEADRAAGKLPGGGNPSRPSVSRPPQGNNQTNSVNQTGNVTLPQAPEPSVPDLSGSIGKLRLTEEYLKSFEAKVKIKRNEIKMDMKAEQMKSDLADYLSILHAAKRYHLVILAANLYRQVFGEGEYPVKISNQVDTALAATRQLEEGVEVFKFKTPRGEYAGAFAALQSAFLASELNPILRSIPLEEKLKMASYQSQLAKVRSYVEARDFDGLEKALTTTEAEAKDFEGAKARSLVSAVKLESQMRLGAAKLAAQDGDRKVAMEEFRAAAEAWPGNPDLRDAASKFFDSQEAVNKGQTKLDDLIAAGNYREIANRQLELLAAVRGNADQEKKFREALEKVRDADIAMERAAMLQKGGDNFGAWEAVQVALDSWPEDTKLNAVLGKYSVKSAEFISLLDKAKTAEEKGNDGQSLSLYVNALSKYPGSRFAREGVERLSKSILTQ